MRIFRKLDFSGLFERYLGSHENQVIHFLQNKIATNPLLHTKNFQYGNPIFKIIHFLKNYLKLAVCATGLSMLRNLVVDDYPYLKIGYNLVVYILEYFLWLYPYSNGIFFPSSFICRVYSLFLCAVCSLVFLKQNLLIWFLSAISFFK